MLLSESRYFPRRPFRRGENARSFKRFYVKQADLDAFGYTPDCVRCKHAMKYGPGRTNMPHSDQCRPRIAEVLQGTEVGRRRLAAFEARTSQQIAIENQANQRSATELKTMLPMGGLYAMDKQRSPVQLQVLNSLVFRARPSRRLSQRRAITNECRELMN